MMDGDSIRDSMYVYLDSYDVEEEKSWKKWRNGEIGRWLIFGGRGF
jgi:hypothetical protein